MNTPCPRTDASADAYVSGLLPEEEQSAFEEHFFECDACFSAVRRLQDVQQVLPDSPPVAAPAPTIIPFGRPEDARRTRLVTAWTMLVAASLVAMTGVGVWQLRGNLGPPQSVADGHTNPATPGPSTGAIESVPGGRPPVPSAAADPLLALAIVSAPEYISLDTRAARSGADRPFEVAMKDYVAARYDQAAAALSSLADRAPSDARVQFFLGVSRLLSGDAAGAIAPLERCVSLQTPPFATEAHFYLAKAALASRDRRRAEAELRKAVAVSAGPEGEARRALTALEALPR